MAMTFAPATTWPPWSVTTPASEPVVTPWAVAADGLNAFVHKTPDIAMTQARAADIRIGMGGVAGSMTGVGATSHSTRNVAIGAAERGARTGINIHPAATATCSISVAITTLMR